LSSHAPPRPLLTAVEHGHRCHGRRELLCSWPGRHSPSPGHPRPRAGAREAPSPPSPLTRRWRELLRSTP
jgi:hypothetical protein